MCDKVQVMNRILRVGQQVVSYDLEATNALYANTLAKAGADECDCGSCRNFAAQRTKAYPDEFVGMLTQLGADPLKELEAFDYDFGQPDATQLYGGWFVFSGEIIEGGDWRPEHRDGTFAFWFTANFPTGGLPKEQKFCAVEFLTALPWILPELHEQAHRGSDSR